jgi:hypothetical protein
MLLILIGTFAYLIFMLILGGMLVGGIYIATRKQPGQIDEGRRSFIGMSGQEATDYTVFVGVQLVIQVFGSDDLRAKLKQLVDAEEYDAQGKRRFMKSVASLLLENQYAWEYGYWDYRTDANDAITNFSQWRNEIEASMATEEHEMGSEVDRLRRFSDNKEFVIVSLMMLIDSRDEAVEDDVGSYEFRPTYQQLAQPLRSSLEGIPESQYWRTTTFITLLESIRALDPRAIERDAFFVYPGTENDGISSMDLFGDAAWKYLTDHPLRFS